jgi:anthranilate synthase component 2
MVLIIDNYDSFTYNLAQLSAAVHEDIRVIRNDEMTVDEVVELSPSYVIISSGPGFPENAGICKELVMRIKGKVPVLGINLGHMAICEAFGASGIPANKLFHGKQSGIHIANGCALFKGLPPIIQGARYHSFVVGRMSLPDELLIIAEDEDGEVMGVKHRDYEIYGLQFHPESILTPRGDMIISNFLRKGGEG